MKRFRLAAALSLALASCQEPSPLAPSPPAAPSSSPSVVASSPTPARPPASAEASSAPAPVVSASAPAPSASAPSQPPLPAVKTEGWAAHESKALKLSFKFPKETFTLADRGGRVTLVSKLSRKTLGENSNARHTFSVAIEQKKGAPEAVFAKDYPSFEKLAFPKGLAAGLDPDNGSVTKARAAGLEGLRLSMGVEGYNSEVLFLARGKDTLVLHADIVGDIMSPETPEDTQRAIAEAIFASVVVK